VDKELLVIPVENDIQTLNPTTLSDPYTSKIVWQIYEGLLGLDENGKPLPMIAESWSANEDYTVWTFNIRPNVFFQKSSVFNTPDSTRTVNARDVARSYKHFAKGFGSFVFSGLVEGFEDYIANKSKDISGFKADGEMIFRVTLNHRDPSFIYRITSPYLSIMPYEVIENTPAELGVSVNIGTGPFKFMRRTETEVYLERNEYYWRKTKGNVKRIIFRVEKNQQLRLTQFKTGQFSIMQIPVSAIPEFFNGTKLKEDYSKEFATYKATTFNVHYLGINNQAISNVHLRRAIAYAIDKKSIVDKLLYSYATTAESPVLPGMQGYVPPSGPGYNTDSARIELALSGYKGTPIKLFVSDVPNSEQIGLIIQSDLKKAGINIEIVKLDFNTLISRLFSDSRPELFVAFSEWVFSTPELIMDSYNSNKFPNPNLFAYKNSQVDTLLSEIPQLKTREEINALCAKIESVASPEVPAVWLFNQNQIYLMNIRLKGFSVNGHNQWNLLDVYYE